MTTPDQYTPRQPSIVDVIAYSRRLLETVMRNNPLTDATVDRGLIKWFGNYPTQGTSSPINFLWIGEFLPADTNLGGVPQRGFSLVRDDSRGGKSAVAMFDPTPGAGGGLRQTLVLGSGDGFPLSTEHRNGGEAWPGFPVPMAIYGDDLSLWPSVVDSNFFPIMLGQAAGLGRTLSYRIATGTTGGAAGELRVRAIGGSMDVSGSVHTLAAGGQGNFFGAIDVSAARGGTIEVYVEGRRTNGVGKVHATVGYMVCRSEA